MWKKLCPKYLLKLQNNIYIYFTQKNEKKRQNRKQKVKLQGFRTQYAALGIKGWKCVLTINYCFKSNETDR